MDDGKGGQIPLLKKSELYKHANIFFIFCRLSKRTSNIAPLIGRNF